MEKDISLYLAGKIQKAHENPNETYWTEIEQDILRRALASFNVHFLNPAIRSDDLSDQRSVFGRDMIQVASADAVFVDARDRRGLGVGAEMMWAKMHSIPVITLSPLGSHYHKSSTSLLGVEVESWRHPFIEGLSDAIVETLEEGAQLLINMFNEDSPEIKGPSWIHEAMSYYLETQFPSDAPMIDLAKSCPELNARLNQIATQETATSRGKRDET